MKRLTTALCLSAFLISCNENASVAENKTGDSSVRVQGAADSTSDAWVPVDSATAMKTMMEVGTPGPEHQMLAKSNGVWNAEMTMWMSDGGQPTVSKATCTNKMLFDGRYQQSNFKGDFAGMPFEGVSTTGYDKGEKVYFSTWMDNMSTGMMTMKGNWDEPSKSITFTGKMLCPANGKWAEMKEVFRIVDDKTQVMEMYGPDMKTGKQFKSMEIKFTRK